MKQMGGYSDLTPGRAATGQAALEMRLWHCVTTNPGQLPQDPAWGWGIRRRLAEKTSGNDLKTEAAIGREALKKDPEVRDVQVTISPLADSPNRYRVQLIVTPKTGGTFETSQEVSA